MIPLARRHPVEHFSPPTLELMIILDILAPFVVVVVLCIWQLLSLRAHRARHAPPAAESTRERNS